LFKDQGLTNFLIEHSYFYPDLVKVFYSNLETKRGVITSEVKGKKIAINETLFTSLIGLKHEGVKLVIGEKCPFDGYNKIEFYNSHCRHSFKQYK